LFAHELIRKPIATFRHHARAEMKCAASPGGTFFILVPGFGLSTRALARAESDSIMPQVPILKEKLLVVGLSGLAMLARESLHIVAFF
jgi:hypothetical protein